MNSTLDSEVATLEKAQNLDFTVSSGHCAFMVLCTALVQFMTPGLALFYGGIGGSTSMVSVAFQSFICCGLVFLIWVVFGFSLAFGDPLLSIGGYNLLGNPATFFMLRDISIYKPFMRGGELIAPGFPGTVYATYQGMFAVITPALISGSFQDRLQFGPYLVYITLWLVFVYCPIGYWNWGGGWMAQIGAYDFAGGLVVHVSAGFASFAACKFLGPRKAPEGHIFSKAPHNIPFTLLGTAMLWLGWFGFNGGSALGSGGLAGIAFLNTQAAASSGMVTWVMIDWMVQGRPKLIGACGGAICGMVVITPGAGYMQPSMAVLAGIIGSIFCYNAIFFVEWLGIDDAVDSAPVHGMGGFLGAVLIGVLSDPMECGIKATAPDWCANPGTATRGLKMIGIQLGCSVISALWSGIVTYSILTFLNAIRCAPLLNTVEEQNLARDEYQHGEQAYSKFPYTKEVAFPSEENSSPLTICNGGDSSGDEGTSFINSQEDGRKSRELSLVPNCL
eukprot:TRINITY_DN36960_c0_g1_i2.p1 TRINITY_DN36960_c0_g1~~TRINITY_DN36960_c0_g1_i2.p1  ORF type:complete len:504 (-),score=79.20 TRINITY_DN36960_c0_g1_i2:152-1663(-)